MNAFQERFYGHNTIARNSNVILVADIGGTNSNFGIFDMRNGKLKLLFSLHAKSQEVKDFPTLVQQVLKYAQEKFGLIIDHALFACAGVVSVARDFSKPTNLDLVIDAHAIKKATSLKCIYLVNDFEVIGYGIDLIDPKNLVLINKGTAQKHANKAIVGAGTGVGKCIMFYNSSVDRYVPVASEGGHEDAALQHPVELQLAQFMQKVERLRCNISWEDLLSGNGIKKIYQFFHKNAAHKDHHKDEKVPHPDEIFKQRNHNQHSADTFKLYTTLYARCAKNFALDALALGGLYIAGGIAAHNVHMFQLPLFMEEFINCGKQAKLLSNIPIYVITDYNVSLYGAAAYLLLEDVCLKS